MKKCCLLFSFLLSITAKSQQDSTRFEKLLEISKNIYIRETSNDTMDFYSALRKITRYFNPYNEIFITAATEFGKYRKGENMETVCLGMTDSIYERIRTDYLWHEREKDLVKFISVFESFNKEYCPCITSQKEFSFLDKSCEAEIGKNFLFMKAFRAQLEKFSFDEKSRVNSLFYWYEYQHCPAFTQYIHATLLGELKENLNDYIFSRVFALSELFFDTYKGKNNDSLVQLFPSFNNYKSHIEAFLKTVVPGSRWIKRQDRKEKEMTTTFFTTYYKKDKTPVILGQTACTIDWKDGFNPVIKNFQFTPASKLTNTKALLKEIAEEVELPPPPMIETLPKKN